MQTCLGDFLSLDSDCQVLETSLNVTILHILSVATILSKEQMITI